MLYPRIIPCLLVSGKGLVKTVKFASPKYVGDPLNAVRIFNEKEVDELMVLDIDATREGRAPDYALIASLADECRMPLCYGGGVSTAEQIREIIQLGVEKVAVSSAAMEDPGLITEASARVGSQSVVAVLDVRRHGSGEGEVWTRNGTRATGEAPAAAAARMERLGAGEIVVNSIDRDGTMLGYDLDLVDDVRRAVGVPLTVLGGAASLGDVRGLISRCGTIGAAAGSLFVFKGRYKAVLINYPGRSEKSALFADAMGGGAA
ncbi:MAG TPA: AglZ/HisF2 family acetamidino modification protein, partial [Elusimicrobiales bacterium]|nr:AglZ/HisF2 family acetamidino modification protein [Elusimicrobiales bacterium]